MGFTKQKTQSRKKYLSNDIANQGKKPIAEESKSKANQGRAKKNLFITALQSRKAEAANKLGERLGGGRSNEAIRPDGKPRLRRLLLCEPLGFVGRNNNRNIIPTINANTK